MYLVALAGSTRAINSKEMYGLEDKDALVLFLYDEEKWNNSWDGKPFGYCRYSVYELFADKNRNEIDSDQLREWVLDPQTIVKARLAKQK